VLPDISMLQSLPGMSQLQMPPIAPGQLMPGSGSLAGTPTVVGAPTGTPLPGAGATAVSAIGASPTPTTMSASPTPTATLSLGAPTPTSVAPGAPRVTGAVPAAPLVTIDSPEGGTALANGRSTLIGGWAVDPRGSGLGITAVDVFLDGKPGQGTFVGAAEYGLTRDDVAGYFQRSDWKASGFNMDWTPRSVAPGQHTLVVVAQTAAGDSTSTEMPITIR